VVASTITCFVYPVSCKAINKPTDNPCLILQRAGTAVVRSISTLTVLGTESSVIWAPS